MPQLSRLFTSFFASCLTVIVCSLAFLTHVSIAYAATSCDAQFFVGNAFSTAQLANDLRIHLPFAGDTPTVEGGDLFVAFPVDNTITASSSNILYPYLEGTGQNFKSIKDGSMGNLSLETKGGTTYLVGKITNFSSLYYSTRSKNPLQFAAQFTGQVACPDATRLPVIILKENCIFATSINTCRRGATGTYDLAYSVSYSGFRPGVRYNINRSGTALSSIDSFTPTKPDDSFASNHVQALPLEALKEYTLCLSTTSLGCFTKICAFPQTFKVGATTPECGPNPLPIPAPPGKENVLNQSFQLCQQIDDVAQANKCRCCALSGNPNCGVPPPPVPGEPETVQGLWTAVGCVPTTYKGIVGVTLKIALMTGGGMALLMILSASLTLTTSEGDSKKTNDCKDRITAACVGLVFISFSIPIFQFIGVDIIRIPGFGQ